MLCYAQNLYLPTTILQESNGSNAKSITTDPFCKVGTAPTSSLPVFFNYRITFMKINDEYHFKNLTVLLLQTLQVVLQNCSRQLQHDLGLPTR